jgi:hypothetical protein
MTQNDHNENGFARASGVAVVRVNDRGGAPPDPPLLVMVMSRAHPPFFVFFKKSFLANEQENIFGGLTVKYNYKKPHQKMAGLVTLDARDSRQRDRRQRKNKGCRASGVNSRRIRVSGLQEYIQKN